VCRAGPTSCLQADGRGGRAHCRQTFLIPAGVGDPTWGLYSPTLGAKGPTLNRQMTDGMTDIVAGRRPLAEFDQMVKDWQAGGGDQIRKELLDALSSSGRA